jgi:hypothetical protein
MGVWHFLSLGESPGAVTAALAYIKRQYELNNVAFFGSDSGRSQAKKVSGIVIFTTPEVRYGRLVAGGRTVVDNPYGSPRGRTLPLGNRQSKITTCLCSKSTLTATMRQFFAFCKMQKPGSKAASFWKE